MSLRHQLILFAAFSIFVAACSDQQEKQQTETALPQVVGLFPPLDLGVDTTTIILKDYFQGTTLPDSISTPAGLRQTSDSRSGHLTLVRTPDSLAWLSTLGFHFGDKQLDLLLRRNRKQRTVIRHVAPAAKSVQVAGEMNGWNPASSPMKAGPQGWETEFLLNPGAYQYQLVVDGQWMLDPANPRVVANGIGGFNCELQAGSADARNTPLQLLSTYDHSPGKLRIMVKGIAKLNPQDLFVFHDNQRIATESTDPTEGGLLIGIPIPPDAKARQRSHIRAWYRTNGGWSNDLLIPLHQGQVVENPAQITPADQHANILYFLMVDRFLNGNTANDRPLTDPEVHPKANYHGGDLAGVIKKLNSGYFDSLGINLVWLSPIVQNPDSAFREYPAPNRKYSGYHGYWPVASDKIDHRFGTPAELDSLVAIAHRQGRKVILDYVANHVHQEHPIMKLRPDWKTPLHINDSTLNVRQWDAHRLTTWFDTFLPSLDHAKPEVIEWQVDTAVWWVSRYNLDGFRHDATKHIEEAFWRRLTEKLRTDHILKHGKPLFQIGETFGSRELIGSYVGAGLLDAQFDFNHYFDIRSVFSQDGQDIQDLILASFRESEAYYGSHSLMGNITGNHDMARFISYASNGLRYDEDPKAAGWNRDITVWNPVGYARLRMLTAYLSAIPGLPVIYYGDEIGMPGGDDPDNRRDMRFSGLSPEELKTRNTCAQLLKLRRNHLAALYGETTMTLSGRTLVIHRHYFSEDLWYIFNIDSAPAKVKSPAYGVKPLVMATPMEGENLLLPAWGFEVLGR